MQFLLHRCLVWLGDTRDREIKIQQRHTGGTMAWWALVGKQKKYIRIYSATGARDLVGSLGM